MGTRDAKQEIPHPEKTDKAVEMESTKQAVSIDLPWPPTANRYWRRVNGRTILSRAARQFRKRVRDLWFVKKYVLGKDGFADTEVRVEIDVYPPDRRRRDIDNVVKAVLDALVDVNIIDDDSQVKELRVVRHECIPGGQVRVRITE
ncbi:MAG: RusA family crossover junction endodeoxyribonuclease [Chloroflexi bacterium]|uniref:RusA family crossover junction endodeoxyribonuclease n=1 Tax=Thermogutta sp. TaxID=1962930 RepID=UPI0019C2ED27|nr:RusA family crossover junction endodeoxyribonuclease [Thermogutta sp.]MBC7238568.1 RusA family crossover junction endodeoxyribonuclease [Chloroflexota bacterium]MBC7351427.1 RusA family crossover junction endodeoxyribonuclease [Thermogutta sp.]